MKTIALVLMLCACCSLGPAQTKADAQVSPQVRLYEPKNLTPERARFVATSVQNMTQIRVAWDDVPHAFIIRGTPQEQDMAEALLKRYDIPDPKVELTVYLIRASGSASSAGSTPVPAELKSAIDEMKGTFNYDHYGLWDTIVLPIKTNGEVQGILPTSNPNAVPSVYTVSYETSGSPLETKTVNFSHFQFALKFAEIESHIRTDVTIHEGQKLVLGKIRLLSAVNADLFLVLTTKVY